MATIKFYGHLKQYGDKFKINADNAAQSMQCLYVQISGLKQAIMDGHFRVRINKQDITESSLKFGLQSKLPDDAVIHIVPVVAGRKSGGLFGVIAGAAMVIVGAFNLATPWGLGLLSAGIGMMVGGVAQMLTKMPETSTNAGVTRQNTSFSSLDNTIAQGAPVPLCYGKMMVGSKVLSQGLETL